MKDCSSHKIQSDKKALARFKEKDQIEDSTDQGNIDKLQSKHRIQVLAQGSIKITQYNTSSDQRMLAQKSLK